jgi:hypothetical protein
MMVFLYFSATTVHITCGGFTFHNYYLHGSWIIYIMQEYEILNAYENINKINMDNY